jgi:hypothetical protein
MRPPELRCTRLRYVACTLLSYAASYWVSLLPTDLSCTLQIKGAFFWATRHPTELRCSLLGYAVPHWAWLHSTELTLYVNIFRMPEWRTVRHLHCQSSTGVDANANAAASVSMPLPSYCCWMFTIIDRDEWCCIRKAWVCEYFRGGSLHRSTGQNINGPNINELQINCSIGQQKPVDV